MKRIRGSSSSITTRNFHIVGREAHSALFGRRTTKKPRPHASFFDPIEAENRGGSLRDRERFSAHSEDFGVRTRRGRASEIPHGD